MAKNNISTSSQRVRRRGQRPTKEERDQIQTVFLQAFSMTANVRAACLKAGIDRSQIYRWQEHDEQFAFRFHAAELDANDMIRAELFRRAVQGVDKTIISVGKVVYDKDGRPMTERVYSDSLLSLLAKARMPEFRDKQQVEATINHSGSIDTKHTLSIDIRKVSDDELNILEAMALRVEQGTAPQE